MLTMTDSHLSDPALSFERGGELYVVAVPIRGLRSLRAGIGTANPLDRPGPRRKHSKSSPCCLRNRKGPEPQPSLGGV